MRKILDAGAAQTIDPALGWNSRKNMYKNSCEWIKTGRAALFALSPIHDSAARPGIPAGKSGFFDKGKNYTAAGATYSSDTNNNVGLEIQFSSVLGSMSTDGTTLTILDPVRQSQSLLVETLIHEVQHDADQHQSGAPWAVPKPTGGGTAPAWAYNNYQTEFRAYWLENPEGSKADKYVASTKPVKAQLTVTAATPGADGAFGTADDVSLGTVTTALINGRQEAILRQLVTPLRAAGDWWANGAWTQSYAYVAYYMVTDPNFLAMVNNFARPIGGNSLNSVRVQDLSDAIAAKDVGKILLKLASLDEADKMFLRDQTTSKPFWDQAKRDLTGVNAGMIPRIRTAVTGGVVAPVAGGGTYTVVRGDTLATIAARLLGDQNRWREIYSLNRAIVGADPGKIVPGQLLTLPKG